MKIIRVESGETKARVSDCRSLGPGGHYERSRDDARRAYEWSRSCASPVRPESVRIRVRVALRRARGRRSPRCRESINSKERARCSTHATVDEYRVEPKVFQPQEHGCGPTVVASQTKFR